MPNSYDRILKENGNFLVPIIAQWFGINLSRVEILKDKMHRTLESEADFCAKIKHDDPKDDYIFHLEVQSTPYYSTYRGLFYRSFFSYTYNLPVRQAVVYVGDLPHQIVSRLEEPGLSYEFQFVDFKSRSYREFFIKTRPKRYLQRFSATSKAKTPKR
jgi:hypothetical protein